MFPTVAYIIALSNSFCKQIQKPKSRYIATETV